IRNRRGRQIPSPLVGTRAGRELAMTWFNKITVLAVVATSALMLSPSRANAGFLSPSTGNTLMRDTPSRSGVVSFTVFQTSGPTANWVNELNTALVAMGSAPVTASFLGASNTTANYVYLYQVVNVSTANGKIEGFAVA